MGSQLQPIKVWGKQGPNPPKVAIVLEELGVPYEIDPIAITDVKQPSYLAINPNGRIPAIHDPNTGLTLWESAAIVEYLVEKYDTAAERRLGFAPGSHDSYLAKQWLAFQISGQGPYYGQAVWFTKYHPEELPSARERYYKEVNRVTGVLEGALAKQKQDVPGSDGPWLVGGRFSYADLAFLPWQRGIAGFPKEVYDAEKYPLVTQWVANMEARKSVKKVFAEPGGH